MVSTKLAISVSVKCYNTFMKKAFIHQIFTNKTTRLFEVTALIYVLLVGVYLLAAPIKATIFGEVFLVPIRMAFSLVPGYETWMLGTSYSFIGFSPDFTGNVQTLYYPNFFGWLMGGLIIIVFISLMNMFLLKLFYKKNK